MLEISRIIDHNKAKLFSPSWKIALGYLLALAVSETFSVLINPQAGLILYGIILLALLFHASTSFRKSKNRFLIILALVPVIRLVSLTLPLYNFPPIYRFAIVGFPLSLTAFIGAKLTGLKMNMIGLHTTAKEIPLQLLIGLTGLGLGLFEYLILRPEPLFSEMGLDLIWLSIIILLVFIGFLEEVIFRGMLQSTATQHLGRIGVLYVAVLFAVLHIGFHSVLNVLFVFVVALLFGLIVQRRGTLLGVSISHGLTNISLFLVFPLIFGGTIDSGPINSDQPILQVASSTPSPTIALPIEYTNTPFSSTSTPANLVTEIQAGNLLEWTVAIPSEPTIEPTRCSAPQGWLSYIVKAGDTLWGISMLTGENVDSLRTANCLENASLIYIGQSLYVPRFIIEYPPSSTASPVFNPTLAPTQTPSFTAEPSPIPTQPNPVPTIPPRSTPTLAPTTVPSGNE